jgi:uncharacterized protein (DUF58 family)
MIFPWRKNHSDPRPADQRPTQHADSFQANSHAAAGDGLVFVTPKYLIKLRHAAESLPLKVAKVKALQTGEYYSPFKGRGMEFDEVRLYQPGDDIRTIDWRVTARSGTAHTKLFREERERSVILWVDFRQTMYFGTRGAFKSVTATKAAALFAWSAEHQGDRLGGLLFSEQQHQEIRPQRSTLAVMHMLQKLSQYSSRQLHKEEAPPEDRSLNDALSRLRRVTRPGSMCLLISDFRGLDEKSEAHLFQLAKHNDVILVYIYDPLEAHLPPAGFYRISDSQVTKAIDTSDTSMREDYLHRHQEHIQRIYRISRRNHIHFLPLGTADDLLATVQKGLGIRGRAT